MLHTANYTAHSRPRPPPLSMNRYSNPPHPHPQMTQTPISPPLPPAATMRCRTPTPSCPYPARSFRSSCSSPAPRRGSRCIAPKDPLHPSSPSTQPPQSSRPRPAQLPRSTPHPALPRPDRRLPGPDSNSPALPMVDSQSGRLPCETSLHLTTQYCCGPRSLSSCPCPSPPPHKVDSGRRSQPSPPETGSSSHPSCTPAMPLPAPSA